MGLQDLQFGRSISSNIILKPKQTFRCLELSWGKYRRVGSSGKSNKLSRNEVALFHKNLHFNEMKIMRADMGVEKVDNENCELLRT